MHLRPHVAGVDGPHAQCRLLGGEHGAHVVEGGLGEPVASPPLVGLDRCVRSDVEHGRARRVAQGGEGLLHQGEGCHHVDLHGPSQFFERVGAEPRERGGAQRAGVVHDEVDTTEGERRVHERPPVRGVGDVAGHGFERGALGQARPDGGGRLAQRRAVAAVDDEAPAPGGELLGQCAPQAPGGSCHHCDRHGRTSSGPPRSPVPIKIVLPIFIPRVKGGRDAGPSPRANNMQVGG